MQTRIEELCKRPIVAPRDLEAEPITRQEILDCLLLTAALDRENAGQLKQAMEAMAFCSPNIADIAKRNLAELRRLPEIRRDDRALPTDLVDLDDRLPEMTAAREALRGIADAYPAQAKYLNAGADILETWWTPITLDD